MKVLSGTWRGRNIFMPAAIRPTQNVTRKAVFDIIGHDLEGISFLELFAGSGAMGIEAMSLGASPVYFVEHDPVNVGVIEENLALLKPVEHGLQAKVLKQDAFFAIKEFARQKQRFDVVFFDPPYGLKLAKKTLKTLMSHDILTPHSLVVVEYSAAERMPEVDDTLRVIKEKAYGNTCLTIYERQSAGEQVESKVF